MCRLIWAVTWIANQNIQIRGTACIKHQHQVQPWQTAHGDALSQDPCRYRSSSNRAKNPYTARAAALRHAAALEHAPTFLLS